MLSAPALAGKGRELKLRFGVHLMSVVEDMPGGVDFVRPSPQRHAHFATSAERLTILARTSSALWTRFQPE